MRKWTAEQLDAITVRERSVIVSAAAGSGKTSVLVERLIRIIADRENPVPIEKIIVVTFTNDAAAEMKQRLSMSLSELMEQRPSDKWISRQHAMLGNAAISTIHSFCFELIRDNISMLSLASDFRIIDETEENILKDSVLRDLIDSYYEKYPELMEMLNNNFCGNNDAPLCRMILDLYSSISSIPFFENWLSKLNEQYDSNMYLQEYIKRLKSTLTVCGKRLDTAYKKASDISDDKLIMLINDDKNILNKAILVLETDDYDEFSNWLSNVKYKNFPTAGKNYAYPEERQSIKKIRDSVKEIVKSMCEKRGMLVNAHDDIKRHKEVMSALSQIIIQFSENLYRAKESKNAIGFDDAEQIVLNLLAECSEDGKITRTKLAEELSEYYQVIMIDEFQDSNNRQDMIFRLLSHNGSAEEYGNNLFFVGDVKQSIYRFRLANPDNFINAVNNAVPYKESDKRNSYIKLNRNFRSSEQVINFVNYVFKNIMSESAGDIDYNEEEYLIKGAEFYENNRDTHIMLIDKSDDNYEDIEAVCVAEKIRRMLNEKNPVSKDNGKSSRPCEMRDFCILLRNRKKIPVYARELEKNGITVSCEEVSGYLKSREVSILLNLLRVVDNPLSDIPIASVMLSPMFMFSADELTEIRLINKEHNIYTNLYDALGIENDNPIFSKDDIIYTKLKFLYDMINELRLLSSFYTLPELIQKIYDSTDFTSVIQLYKDSEKKKANLRMLLEYANSYELNSGSGLSGFIRYIDNIMESKGDFRSGNVSASSQNAVCIKTMHKSKGLEFPFVFIAETSTKFSIQDKLKPFQFSYDCGIGFKFQNKEKYEKFTTIPYEYICSYNQNKMLSEEMRLLYVALTRAKERLFITVNRSESEADKAQEYAADIYINQGITSSLVSSAKSMGDWILMTLLSHRKSGYLREIFGVYESFVNNDDFLISYEDVRPNENFEEYKNSEEAQVNTVDNETVKKLRKYFEFEYDLTLAELNSKLSVSDVSKKDDSDSFILSRPMFMTESGELTAAEKGTALHRFLQFTDFQKLEDDFKKEKKRMLDFGYISQKQSESIQYEDIDAFLHSEIYKMIKNSYRIIREKKFLISINDLELENEFSDKYKGTDGMLNGIIDMIIENEDHFILVDYKTDKINNINIIAEKYKGQIYLYKKALEKMEKKTVKAALIYSFYKKTEIRIF